MIIWDIERKCEEKSFLNFNSQFNALKVLPDGSFVGLGFATGQICKVNSNIKREK